MQNARSPSGPPLPRLLLPLVRLLQWSRRGLGTVAGPRCVSPDLGGALLLVGAITLAAVLGAPPLLTVGGGVGLAVLFVVARSWVVVREQQVA